MAKGKRLTDEQRQEIYEAHMLGESNRDIAEAYGIVPDSVRAIVRRQRKLLESEGGSELSQKECVVAGNRKDGRLVSLNDPMRYEGTCVINGRARSRRFTAPNVADAVRQWEAWCEGLPEKHERTAPGVAATPAKPVAVREQVRQETKGEVVELQAKGENVYVIWAKGESPKLYGAYTSMERALSEVDKLNEVASFLVSDRVFDVEELAVKS